MFVGCIPTPPPATVSKRPVMNEHARLQESSNVPSDLIHTSVLFMVMVESPEHQ